MSDAADAPVTTPADRVFFGTVITMDEAVPDAEAVAVGGGRILFVGSRDAAASFLGDDTTVTELADDSVLLPGFVEAHGHPTFEAVLSGPTVVDIRPVTIPTAEAVLALIDESTVAAGSDGIYFNGWDPLLQVGLPEPSLAWLDGLSSDVPLVILHNSGHSAYFNSLAAERAGITRDTPDPVGASYGRDANGELDGSLLEAAAIMTILGPALVAAQANYAALMRSTSARMNAAGVTTVGELGFEAGGRPLLDAAREAGALSVRLRLYETSTPELHTDAQPGDGDEMVRQVGIKLWADGSPWVGNIATSFDYLDTAATRSIGLEPHHRGHANYTPEQLFDISEAYFSRGWQLACHVHGDVAVDMVLDVWEEVLRRHPRDDHRLRLEHVGAMTAEQFERAARLGVTASLFIDHVYYWGAVLVDGLFGLEHGAPWVRAGSALAAGLRISFHNDGSVTPSEPLRNIEVAVTRRTRSGRIIAPEERIGVMQALRAQTIDSAYHLFSDHEVGSIAVGKLADLVVLAANPLTANTVSGPAGAIADIPVLETVLAGDTVWAAATGRVRPR